MKYIKYLAFIIIAFFTFNIDVNASTKVYERTKKNYRVPMDVKVTSNNEKDILNTLSVNQREKIYDFAEVLSEKEELKLKNKIKKFTKKTGIDSIILTTTDLNSYHISDYTYNFYDYNDFSNEGIIFTIYINPDSNKVSIFMGNSGGKSSKVFKVYNDENINATLKYVYNNYIKEGKYYDACFSYLKITNGLYVKSYGNYKVDKDGKVVTNIPWFYLTIMSLCIAFAVTIFVYTKYNVSKRRVDKTVRKCADYGSMVVKTEYDKIVDINELK